MAESLCKACLFLHRQVSEGYKIQSKIERIVAVQSETNTELQLSANFLISEQDADMSVCTSHRGSS